MPRSERAQRILCYVTDRRALGASNERTACAALLQKISAALDAGTDWVQIREKDMEGRGLTGLVRAAMENSPGRTILVNDRLDVAIAVGAAGVHLGGESLPVAEVVSWCRSGRAPADFLVGRSCHSMEEAKTVQRDGAHYIFYGPVFATPSKALFGAPQGIGKLEEVCRRVRIPVLAIGGVTIENAAECFRAGAVGIAAIRLFQEAADVAAVIAHLRKV